MQQIRQWSDPASVSAGSGGPMPGLAGDSVDEGVALTRGRRQAGGLRARLDHYVIAVSLRTGVSPQAVVGLILVIFLVLSVLGVRVLMARARAVPVPIATVGAVQSASASASVSGTASTAASAPGQPAAVAGRIGSTGIQTLSGAPGPRVVVHVVGQVRRPGVVTLSAGARVRDAVLAAGGARSGADVATINLARVLVDGEQVYVPRPGQTLPPMAGGSAGTGGSAAGPVGASGQAQPGSPAAMVDLNTATLADLDALSGIGPVLAQRILDWRNEHGRFSSVDELNEVSGIGDATFERLRPHVRV